MTDFDAATAKRGLNTLAAVTCVALIGLSLAGCADSAGSLFGGGPTAEVATPPAAAAAPAATQPLARVALAPIVGAPDSVSKLVVQQFTASAERQRLKIVPDRDPTADFALRGYLVASRDKAGTKISYIWDVTDRGGKRVNRITGEEIGGPSPNPKDAWAGVAPSTTQNIADRTATSLATWVPSQASAGVPMASAGPAAQPSGVGAASPVQQASHTAASQATTTAALPPSDGMVTAMPTVSGAPGDADAALAAALQRELTRQGVSTTDRAGGGSYVVEGKVVLGQLADGKQPIQIDWRVKDPQGKALGTVTQKNDIPPGSLDGSWGKTADAAAAAAAQGIIKLLPQARSVN